MTTHIRKVRPGEPLRIPAGAYNAFVDAERKSRGVARVAGAGVPTSHTKSHLILVRNASGSDVDRYGVIGIDGPIFPPSPASSVAFERQVSLSCSTPDVASHVGAFVITTEPIADGKVGLACASGVCIAQVDYPVGRERRFADIADGVTTHLKAAHRGAASILWKELGTGLKWSIIRFGGNDPFTARTFPVKLELSTLGNGSATTPTTHRYDVLDAETDELLESDINPSSSPHQWRRSAIGRYATGTSGLAYYDLSDNLVVTWTNEVPEFEVCAEPAS